MNALRLVLQYILVVYLVLVIARVVVSWIQVLSPSMRPTGVAVVIFEIVYTATDPPIRLLRRLIPPLRFGNMALDLGVMILIIVLYILIDQVARI